MAQSVPSPFVLPLLNATLAPDFGVTVAAVHGSIFFGLEGYLRIFATRGTDSGMHFPGLIAGAIPATRRTVALLSLGCPAFRTTPGFVGKALVGEELLLGSAETETRATICAFESLIHVSQVGDLLSLDLGYSLVIHGLVNS